MQDSWRPSGRRQGTRYMPWSTSEKAYLCELVRQLYGNRSQISWSVISANLPGRTPQMCKSAYQSIKNKMQLQKQRTQKQQEMQQMVKQLKKLVNSLSGPIYYSDDDSATMETSAQT